MNHLEHYELTQIVTGKPWEIRTRLLAFLKTVDVITHIEDKNVSTGLVAPHRGLVETDLRGREKVAYPEWTGPVNWEPQ